MCTCICVFVKVQVRKIQSKVVMTNRKFKSLELGTTLVLSEVGANNKPTLSFCCRESGDLSSELHNFVHKLRAWQGSGRSRLLESSQSHHVD